MARRFERGNVVGFVLVGVLLTAALIGGIWFANHAPGSSQDTTSDTQNVEQDTSADKTSDTTNEGATTDEELKETLAKQATGSSSQQNTATETTSSTHLPVTGPSDTLFEMAGAMLLAGMSVAYVRSRSVA